MRIAEYTDVLDSSGFPRSVVLYRFGDPDPNSLAWNFSLPAWLGVESAAVSAKEYVLEPQAA